MNNASAAYSAEYLHLSSPKDVCKHPCYRLVLVRHNIVLPSVLTAAATDPKGPQRALTSLMSVSHPRPDRSSVETLMAQCFNDRAQGFLFMLPADLFIFVARAEALIVSLWSFCVSCSTKLAPAVRAQPHETGTESRTRTSTENTFGPPCAHPIP